MYNVAITLKRLRLYFCYFVSQAIRFDNLRYYYINNSFRGSKACHIRFRTIQLVL